MGNRGDEKHASDKKSPTAEPESRAAAICLDWLGFRGQDRDASKRDQPPATTAAGKKRELEREKKALVRKVTGS